MTSESTAIQDQLHCEITKKEDTIASLEEEVQILRSSQLEPPSFDISETDTSTGEILNEPEPVLENSIKQEPDEITDIKTENISEDEGISSY